MRYFDKTFFKFLFGFGLIIILGLVFISKVEAALININTATLAELDSLPGVGPTVAQRIIDGRPYSATSEVSRVEGIGEPGSASYENIINLITISEITTPITTPSPSPSPSPTQASSIPVEIKTLSVDAGKDKTGVVGQPLEFRAEADSNKPTLTWVLGDGSVDYGPAVLHAYDYPGDYIVVLHGTLGGRKATSRIKVKIVPNTLSITHASSDRIEITNSGKTEINLHGRELAQGGKKFVFPEDTIITPGQKISFPAKITGLSPANNSLVHISITGSDLGLTHVASADNQEKIDELVGQVLVLQQKTLDMKKTREINESTQVAAVVSAQATTTSDIKESNSSGWVRVIKKFFGFK